ncbi:MAG: hypothetical protein ACRDR6_05155 [Pseudonocardiaceae bacterium]
MSGTDLYHWIALRRVFDGEVTRLDGCWRDHGHLVPGYVTDALNELLTGGLVTLADSDQTAGKIDPAALTNAGTARFEQLCQTALGLPAAQCAILCGTGLPD